jgi:hypothetical protein
MFEGFKRTGSDATVEKIDNGFLVSLALTDKDNWTTRKVFVEDMKRVQEVLSEYFFLKEV